MTFKSMDEIKDYILSKSQIAIRQAQEEVYGIINRFLKQYYSEYDPSVYERTYQLLRSLVKSSVEKTSNGWTATVYFDISALDYHIKLFTRPQYYRNDVYHSPFCSATSLDGVFPNPKGSAELVMESAMHGTHGGKNSGTAVWDESIRVLNNGAYDILKKWLTFNGIPLK